MRLPLKWNFKELFLHACADMTGNVHLNRKEDVEHTLG